MADPVAQLNQVLMTCGVINQADHDTIINIEGFNLVDDLGVLESDRDVDKMAKCMANHMQADGCIMLRAAVIKHLQALAFWVYDKQIKTS
jgi:hypothetical protein